jgi:hypothetical protein
MPVLIQFRRDTAATWSSVNPTLAEGEVGLELDTGKIKIGNGSSSWANLTYFSGTTSLTNVSSNIVPSSDNVYDLGSPTKLWKHIYTAGGSIYLGNLKITNEDGKLGVTKVVNPGSVNETPDPVDSDGLAGSVNMLSNNGHEFVLTANGTITLNGNIFTTDNNLGNIKINGGIIGTQGLSGNNSWGSYDLSIDPGGQSNAGIYISGLSGQASGDALQIYNIGEATSPIQLFGRGSVQMVTGIGADEKVFEFSGNVLALPPGGDILDSNGVSVLGGPTGTTNTGNITFNDITIQGVGNEYGGGGIHLSPDPSLTANLMYFRVRGGDDPTHLHFDTGNGSFYNQYFGDDAKYLKLAADGNIYVGTNSQTWTFDTTGNLTLPQTVMNVSPAPTSLPGIRFTDGSLQTIAFTGTEFPTNIVNTHNNSSVIAVGGTQASTESLSVRVTNVSNTLGVEVKYSTATTSSISAFRAYPNPTNIYAGLFTKSGSNTDWDNFGNLTTVGDSMSFTVSEHSNHKIYRVLVTARAIPDGGSTVGDAYCVIEKLK